MFDNVFTQVCESAQSRQHGTIDMLPIVTRGCLCELAKKVGITSKSTRKYKLTNQIQTFRHVHTDMNDKFTRNLSLAKLKFPFPHMVSVMMEQLSTGSHQVLEWNA